MPNAAERARWVSWGPRLFDPSVRAARRRRRARRSLGIRGLATIALAYVATRVGIHPGLEIGEVFWGAASAVVGAGTVGAGRTVWRLERAPRPVHVPPAPPPPPRSSAASAPLSRLTAREAALGDLLGVLGPVSGDTWPDASAAAAALRRLGGQLVVLEKARVGVPADARPGLDSAISALLQRMHEGVSAYDRLVSAATEAVAATSDGHGSEMAAVRRLEEAADTLAGLARGLREIPVPPR